MLTVGLLGMRYHRTILETVTPEISKPLKEGFDYSFIVSMGEFIDPAYSVVDKKSCLIDLSKDIDAIISGFNSTSRNEYRRSERTDGLEFHSQVGDFEEYYRFYSACEHDRDWFPVPPAELAESMVFSASYRGHLVSGMSCYGNEKRLRVGRIYSNKRSKKSETLNNTLYGSAAKRIVVEICKYGIERGYESLDLGGVDLSPGSKSGITQFKLSLGGEIVDVKLGRYMTEPFLKMLPTIKEMGWDIT